MSIINAAREAVTESEERVSREEEVPMLRIVMKWLGRHKFRTRWPCQYCGRLSPESPLRMLAVQPEGGSLRYMGCIACNQDDLIEETDACIAEVTRRKDGGQ